MEAFPAGQHGVRSRRKLALSQEVSSIVRLVCVCERTVGTVVRIVPAIFVCCQAGARINCLCLLLSWRMLQSVFLSLKCKKD